MSNSYQLTKHPIGSIREIWTLSWPLMLAMMSTATMLFIDRLLMSWKSPLEFSAVASSGIVYFLFMIIPLWVCNASEVLVGRLNGAGEKTKTGKPVWQLVWASLGLLPIFVFIGYYLSPLIFYNSGNEVNEIAYFSTLLFFGSIHCAQIALTGFFIGTGRTRVVTFTMVSGNALNIILAYLLIFGAGPIPAMGIIGAALGTGFAQIFQCVLLFVIFLSKRNREEYGTSDFKFCRDYLMEGLRIGVPGGCGHAVEIFAHCAFYRIMMFAGVEQILIATVVQTLFLSIGFINDAISKGVSSVVSNLIGARKFDLIKTVFNSSVKLIFIIFCLILSSFFLLKTQLLYLFFTGESAAYLLDPNFVSIATQALLWMTIFFLIDGINWVLIGHMNASGDTKFILYVSMFTSVFLYVLPLYVAIVVMGYGANIAWMLVALYTFATLLIYFWRYATGKWLHDYLKKNPEEITALA